MWAEFVNNFDLSITKEDIEKYKKMKEYSHQKDYKNKKILDEDKLKILKKQLWLEKEFVIGYYNVTKQQIRYMLSEVLNKPIEQCHINKMNYEEICKSFDFLSALIKGARNDGARRIPKSIKNYKKYRKRIKRSTNI